MQTQRLQDHIVYCNSCAASCYHHSTSFHEELPSLLIFANCHTSQSQEKHTLLPNTGLVEGLQRHAFLSFHSWVSLKCLTALTLAALAVTMQTTGIKASMPWRHAMVALKRCYEPGLSGWLERRIEGMFFFLGDGCGTEVMYCWAITFFCRTVFGINSCFLLDLFHPWSDQECVTCYFFSLSLVVGPYWTTMRIGSLTSPYVLRGFSPGVDVQRSSEVAFGPFFSYDDSDDWSRLSMLGSMSVAMGVFVGILIVLADNLAVVRPLNDDWSYADCVRMSLYEFSCRRLSLNYQGMKPSRFWWWFMYLSPSPWSSSPTSPQYGRHVRTSRASCREPSDEEMIRSKVEQSGDQCNSRAELNLLLTSQ